MTRNQGSWLCSSRAVETGTWRSVHVLARKIMIDELLRANRIDQKQYELYQLFQVNELGRKCLAWLMEGTYMDEPTAKEFSGVGFAYYDGRRAVLREIRNAVLFVEEKIRESMNDRPTNQH